MATLYVRDMPDDVYVRLREEAKDARRSIGATAIEILRSELGERRELPVEELLARARDIRGRAARRRDAKATVVEDLRADRER